jgi:hypothetical protein
MKAKESPSVREVEWSGGRLMFVKLSSSSK